MSDKVGPIKTSSPKASIVKDTPRQRPQRAAASKFLAELAKYRQMLDEYHTAYRRYAHEKKQNPTAVAPKKPKIPVEYYQALTADDDDDNDDETSDEEFQAETTSEDDDDEEEEIEEESVD